MKTFTIIIMVAVFSAIGIVGIFWMGTQGYRRTNINKTHELVTRFSDMALRESINHNENESNRFIDSANKYIDIHNYLMQAK